MTGLMSAAVISIPSRKKPVGEQVAAWAHEVDASQTRETIARAGPKKRFVTLCSNRRYAERGTGRGTTAHHLSSPAGWMRRRIRPPARVVKPLSAQVKRHHVVSRAPGSPAPDRDRDELLAGGEPIAHRCRLS